MSAEARDTARIDPATLPVEERRALAAAKTAAFVARSPADSPPLTDDQCERIIRALGAPASPSFPSREISGEVGTGTGTTPPQRTLHAHAKRVSSILLPTQLASP
jgi:hypothetical protein